MSKIQLASRTLKILFRLLSFLIVALTVYLILFDIPDFLIFSMNAPFLSTLQIQHPIYSAQHRLIILAIEALPLTFTVLICLRLSSLFQSFEQGYLFELRNIANIKRIGMYMILSQCIQLIYQPLISATLTYNNPIGERMAAITVGTTNFSNLLTAIIIFVAAWIMQEAYKLKCDSQLTI